MSTLQQNPASPARTGAPPALRSVFDRQRAAFLQSAPDYQKRIASLRCLGEALLDWQDEIVRAANEDFGGRARQETLALELAPLLDGIRHARTHLASWMRSRRVRTGINFFPGRARILYQPLGVVGILSAWNYQTYLSLSPLTDAIAAGNHAMLKPSELAPRTAEVLRKLVASLFAEEYVTVVTGGPEVAAEFSALPFDHLLFTGSTRTGKLVMKAASENLTPVTLEMGGKCPVILHPEFPLRTALERIMTGKLYNAGQTCLAPDYLLVHESQRDELVRVASEVARELYPKWNGNPDYTHIVNEQQLERLHGHVRDAVARGAKVVSLGTTENISVKPNAPEHERGRPNRVFEPVLLLDVDDSMLVLREEIFGPILPVLTYRDLDDALAYVNGRARPLALYYFDCDARRIEHVLASTCSGGVTVNDVIYHIAQNNLPFGGVGPSGMGHYHGFAGFETFSLKRAVFLQSRFNALKFLRPPYGATAERVIRFLLRY